MSLRHLAEGSLLKLTHRCADPGCPGVAVVAVVAVVVQDCEEVHHCEKVHRRCAVSGCPGVAVVVQDCKEAYYNAPCNSAGNLLQRLTCNYSDLGDLVLTPEQSENS